MPNDAKANRESPPTQDEKNRQSAKGAKPNRPRRVKPQATAILEPDPNTLKAR